MPRCRQTFENERTSPSGVRTVTIGASTTSVVR
jgi:hypothetical protein